MTAAPYVRVVLLSTGEDWPEGQESGHLTTAIEFNGLTTIGVIELLEATAAALRKEQGGELE